jgi:hypothetical protein
MEPSSRGGMSSRARRPEKVKKQKAELRIAGPAGRVAVSHSQSARVCCLTVRRRRTRRRSRPGNAREGLEPL